MKFNPNLIARFQEGGPMPGAEGAPMPEEQGAPMGPEAGAPAPEEQMQQMAGQLVDMLMQQIGDPQAVAAILQMALEMVGQAAAPQAAYQRMGGRLVRVK